MRPQKVTYEVLCPIGNRIHGSELRADGDVHGLALKANNAQRFRPDRLEHVTGLLNAARDDRDEYRVELARHVAHCTDGCAMGGAGVPQSGRALSLPGKDVHAFDRAPSHLIAVTAPLPGAAAMAAMIRDGQTAEGLAAVYNRPVSSVVRDLNVAGFSTRGEPLNRGPKKPPKKTQKELRNMLLRSDWQDQALCAEVDSEMFWPEPGHADVSDDAKRVCRMCPVRERCLEAALDTHEDYGIWGGTTEKERRVIRHKRDTANVPA